jgi:hypothetical protein
VSDAATLAIPAYIEKQIAPLRKEIEALRERVKQLEEKPSRGTFVGRVMRGGREARNG